MEFVYTFEGCIHESIGITLSHEQLTPGSPPGQTGRIMFAKHMLASTCILACECVDDCVSVNPILPAQCVESIDISGGLGMFTINSAGRRTWFEQLFLEHTFSASQFCAQSDPDTSASYWHPDNFATAAMSLLTQPDTG